MNSENNEIIRQWFELYKPLTGSEINQRIKEIKETSEVIQRVYQLRALELLMINKRNYEIIS